jgi:hypothetical protein
MGMGQTEQQSSRERLYMHLTYISRIRHDMDHKRLLTTSMKRGTSWWDSLWHCRGIRDWQTWGFFGLETCFPLHSSFWIEMDVLLWGNFQDSLLPSLCAVIDRGRYCKSEVISTPLGEEEKGCLSGTSYVEEGRLIDFPPHQCSPVSWECYKVIIIIERRIRVKQQPHREGPVRKKERRLTDELELCVLPFLFPTCSQSIFYSGYNDPDTSWVADIGYRRREKHV